MMSGVLTRGYSVAESQHGAGEARNLGNGHSTSASPLKLFGLAKKKINDIYKDIDSYVKESSNFLTGM